MKELDKIKKKLQEIDDKERAEQAERGAKLKAIDDRISTLQAIVDTTEDREEFDRAYQELKWSERERKFTERNTRGPELTAEEVKQYAQAIEDCRTKSRDNSVKNARKTFDAFTTTASACGKETEETNGLIILLQGYCKKYNITPPRESHEFMRDFLESYSEKELREVLRLCHQISKLCGEIAAREGYNLT